jgi:uncharacterized RDD family membrane protein YckC
MPVPTARRLTCHDQPVEPETEAVEPEPPVVAETTTCSVCDQQTLAGWQRCGHCGAQRLLLVDGTLAGFRKYAGFWRRAAAVVVDLLIVAGPFAVALWLLPDRERLDLAGVAAFVLVAYQLGVLSWSGDTWGKRVLRAHVVEDDGRPIGHGRVSAREGVAKILEATALLVPFGLILAVTGTDEVGPGIALMVVGIPGLWGLVWAVFDDRRRTLHDRMSGTVCVRGRPVVHPERFTRAPAR